MEPVGRTSGSQTTSTSTSTDTLETPPLRPAESVGVTIGRMTSMLDQSEAMNRRARRQAQQAQRQAVHAQTDKMREAADDKFTAAVFSAVGKMATGASQIAAGVDGLGSVSGDPAPAGETDTQRGARTREEDAGAARSKSRGELYSGTGTTVSAGADVCAAGYQKSSEIASAAAMDLGAAADAHREDAADAGQSMEAAQRSREKVLDFASQLSQAMAESRRAAVA